MPSIITHDKKAAMRYSIPGPVKHFLFIILMFMSTAAFAQGTAMVSDSAAFFTKTNSLQIADYKPPKAKRGRNGVGRITPVFFKSGRHGNDGKNGKNGPDLHIAIAQVIRYGQTVVLVAVHAADKTVADSFYINPQRGQLKIIADGGDGGDGGAGEDESESNSSAGGGNGGNAGNGGNIVVSVEQSDKGLTARGWLIISNLGGLGGRGGSGGKSRDSRLGGSADGANGSGGMMGAQFFK